MECKTQLRYINTKLVDIKRLFRIISHQLNVGINRKKRGLMNFVGNGISYLFGNPNADDATFYSNTINSLIANQKQTHTLMQQQVSIIADTISNFNNSLFRMNANIDTMNRNLKAFNNLSNSIKDMTRKLDLEIQLSNHMLLLIEMTDEVNQLLENYVNDVSLIQNGIISFRMFSPESLYNELQKLATQFSLPIPLTIDNIYRYYKIMQLQSFVHDNLLVIAFKLPLTNMHVYDLYQMFPLPTPHVDDPHLFSYVEPTNPYMLLSTTRTTYLTLNNLLHCREYLPTQWLCQDTPPIRSTTQDQCEVQLLMKTAKEIPKTCKTGNLIANLEIWHKLSNTQWLFSVTEPTQITVVCHLRTPETHETILNNMGILQLNPNCKAYSSHTILEAQRLVGSHNLTHEIPTTDISQDNCCLRLKENMTLNQVQLDPINFVNLDLQELKYAQHKLNQFDEQLQQQLNKPFIIQKSHWYTTALSLLTGTILCTIFYKLAKWCRAFNFLQNVCGTAGNRHPTRLLSSCSQTTSQNKPHAARALNMRYDAELQQLSYQSPTTATADSALEETQSTRASLRRSQRLHSKITIDPS